VVVKAPVVHPINPQCLSFGANKTTITAGESITLNWTVANATRVAINNGIGEKAGSSFGPVTPAANTVYKLTVFGAAGTTPDISCEVPVTVNPKVVTPVCTDPAATNTNESLPCVYPNPTAPAIDIIKRDAGDKNDTQAVVVGGTAIFEIVVANTGNEALRNVVVTDPLEPACNRTIGNLAIGASNTYTCNSTNVRNAFTNIANVTGVSVVDGQTVNDTDPTNVTIVNTQVFTCDQNVRFNASDTSITRGQNSTLNWAVTGADSVSISSINASGLVGNQTVSPSSDTTYVLTATKANFNPISCNVVINVSTGGGGGGGGTATPRCELTISDKNVKRGERVTLTWETSNATEITLKDDRGRVLVTTEDRLARDKRELFDSKITVTPTRDTTYTLVAERGSRDRECKVSVDIEGSEVVLLQSRDQAPLVSGIALTQVPYTGFEAGPMMTIMFYALLVAWVMYITYVLVIPKTMIAAPVLVTPRDTSTMMNRAEQIRPDVFAALPTNSVVASVATAPAPVDLPTMQVASVEVEAPINVMTEVENAAHAKQALLSSGAVQGLIAMTTEANRSEVLAKVITDAKGAYPLEDGWVVINQTRLEELTQAVVAAPAAVTGSGSLAEAIVTGNVVAAYEMIGHRPMFALADASADLDAIYRNRKGANESVSDLLTTESANLSDAQIADMIAALTGALDGTYTDEAAAVKMAIMKAVKVAA